MKRTLEIQFRLDNEKTKTLSLSDPKEDLTRAMVESWASKVVAKKAFIFGGAYPTHMMDASIRTVELEELK